MKSGKKEQRRYAFHARVIHRKKLRELRRQRQQELMARRREARLARGPSTLDPRKILRFELAPQTKIESLGPQVKILLKEFGHPEALVTDESLVWDMLRDGRKLVAIRRKLKIAISTKDYIFAVAERLAAKRKYKQRRHPQSDGAD